MKTKEYIEPKIQPATITQAFDNDECPFQIIIKNQNFKSRKTWKHLD